jgi:GntR family transcriptional regulator
MDLVLNRRGGVPMRDQLVAQLELQILGGRLKPGHRLHSVRALARRLKLHPNTVSAAYRDLTSMGHVEVRRGAGVFVTRRAPGSLEEAGSLDEMIRLALRAAFRKGHSLPAVREAVARWLKAAAPERLVVVDPSPEMGELVAREVRDVIDVPVTSCSIKQARATPALLADALVLTLPYHAVTVGGLAPTVPVEVLHLEFSRKDQEAVRDLAEGATVLVVSHSPTVLPFASVLLRALRGDDLHVEVKLLRSREWRRIVPLADLVLVDALAADQLREHPPRRMREFRVLSESAVSRLRRSLPAVVPRRP